jgi:hypothetical protein
MAHIQVSNGIRSDAYVFLYESLGWSLTDIGFDIGMLVSGVSEVKAMLTGAEGAATLPKDIETAADVVKLIGFTAQLMSGTFGTASSSTNAVEKLMGMIRKISVSVPAGNSVDVADVTFLDYLSPSGVASVFKAKSVELAIISNSGFYAGFTSEADACWILGASHVARCADGQHWKEMPGHHFYNWLQVGVVPSLDDYHKHMSPGQNG